MKVLISTLLFFSYLFSTAQLAYTEGNEIMFNKFPYQVKAISIDQDVLYRINRPEIIPDDAFQEIKNIGFNTVKIRLSHTDFEGAGTTIQSDVWPWLSSYIHKAKNHDLKVILSLYVSPGGHQMLNHNEEFWLNPSFQDRFRNIWAGISRHFKNEEGIIGYELLDSPSPKYSISQWKQLSLTITKKMRRSGDAHIVFVQNCTFPSNASIQQDARNLNFSLLTGIPNIVYSFQYWNSKEYTWQRVKGLLYNNPEKYPDESKYTFPQDLNIFFTTEDNTRIGTGTTEFAYIEGKRYGIKDSAITSILPVIYSDNLLPGSAFYNTIIIKEYSPTGKYLRDVMLADPNKIEGWQIDTKDQRANFKLIPDYGTTPFSVINIDRVETPTRVYNENMRFIPKYGFYYSIGAHCLTKSINVSGESYLRFEFEKSESGQVATSRNKEGIMYELNKYLKWSEQNQVPIMLTDFGASHATFRGGKGGTQYIKDISDYVKKHQLNHSLKAFDGEDFGLYSIKKKTKPEKHTKELLKQLSLHQIPSD